MKKYFYLTILISCVLIFSGCSEYQKLLKSTDYEKKYDRAIEYYDAGDYYRALQLFDQLVPILRAQDKSERLSYYYANCYYFQNDYIMASYYYKRFARSFPTSKWAEEAWYLSAVCKYKESPIYSLDQSVSVEAIEELQSFANRYPKSNHIEEINSLIDQLQMKLAKKLYKQGELYFKTENYQASVTVFQNLLKQYPGIEYKEDVLFKILESYYLYAKHSVSEKQTERYQDAISSYDNLITLYPETKFKKQAEKYYQRSLSFIQNLEQ